MAERRGVVYLVGAGPGDPGLLTRRGETLLRQAEVVVYDRLAAPALLDLCLPEAERIYVGKGAGRHAMRQDEINALLVEMGRAGRRVVRLKGGDPFVFGRGGEEALALQAAGVAFEVVPGVSSAVAAPAYAGIPITHRGLASSFAVATGHEDPTKPDSAMNWQALARGADTLVFLMGVEHLASIAERLLAAGRPADEPVAIVRQGTTPEQETLFGTLGTVVELARERSLAPPAVLVVGAVVGLAERINWLEQRPLHGRRVLVTRAREQASVLSERLAELGAQPLELPTIRVEPLLEPAPLERAVERLADFTWIVFTSVNGVRAAFARLEAGGRDARAFGAARVAAIGPATAESLLRHGIRADLVARAMTSEGIVAELAPLLRPGDRVLLLRADIAPGALPAALAASGAEVEDVAAYRTVPDLAGREAALRQLAAGQINVVTLTSGSTVRNLVEALDGQRALLEGPLLACIGPVTAKAARDLGLRVDLVAPVHTIDGLVEALVERLAPEPREVTL